MSDSFREDLEALLQANIEEMMPEGTEAPVVADWALTVAIDSLADSRQGGHFLMTPKGIHSYRTKGLLVHALNMMRDGERE